MNNGIPSESVSHRNPGRHLQDFYAVGLGLALVLAVEQVIDPGEGSPIDWRVVPLFLAFSAVAFSYYHGSVRYLDVMYGSDSPPLRRGRITSDLIIGAVDLTLLIALGILTSRPIYFGSLLALLMAFEVARVALMSQLLPSDQVAQIERDFAWINAILVVPVILVLLVATRVDSIDSQRLAVGVPLLILMVLRTILSYRRSFDFYFGDVVAPSAKDRTPD